MLTGIKNIIFDLGNVIVDIDVQKTVEAFYALGFKHSIVSQKQEYVDNVIYQLEVGAVTPDVFRDEIRKILNNNSLNDSKIDAAWCAMLLNTPAKRIETLKRIKKQYNIYLFSNTNKIHIDAYHQTFKNKFGFDFSSLFVKDFYSHEINDRKPNTPAFRKVLDIADIKPEESLFIDDLEANIEGAKQVGLHGYWLKKGEDIVEIF